MTPVREPGSRSDPVSCVILGIDGSGKSSVSKRTAQSLSEKTLTACISDDLSLLQNGVRITLQPLLMERLREHIGRMAKNARSLKAYKIPKLTELILRNHVQKIIRRKYHPGYIISDGSPLLNLTAWAMLYKEDYFNKKMCAKCIQILCGRDINCVSYHDEIYRMFWELEIITRLGLNRFLLPEQVIFLDVSPEVALERIELRGKKLQVHETKEALGKLQKAYLLLCDVTRNFLHIPTCILDGNNTLEKNTAEALSYINSTRQEIAWHERPKD